LPFAPLPAARRCPPFPNGLRGPPAPFLGRSAEETTACHHLWVRLRRVGKLSPTARRHVGAGPHYHRGLDFPGCSRIWPPSSIRGRQRPPVSASRLVNSNVLPASGCRSATSCGEPGPPTELGARARSPPSRPCFAAANGLMPLSRGPDVSGHSKHPAASARPARPGRSRFSVWAPRRPPGPRRPGHRRRLLPGSGGLPGSGRVSAGGLAAALAPAPPAAPPGA